MSSSESLATLAEGQLQSTAAIKFSWEGIYEEIAQCAPTLQRILSLALPEEKREKAKITICMIVAMLLKQRNKNAAFLQSLVSLVLFAGGATRQVCKQCMCNCMHHHIWIVIINILHA